MAGAVVGRLILYVGLVAARWGGKICEKERTIMKKTDILYGLEGWERLEPSLEEAVERFKDEAGEDLKWPIRISVFRRVDVGGESMAVDIADDILEWWIDNLLADYGGGEQNSGDVETEKMRNAALAFGRAVVEDYVPWACEETGEVCEVYEDHVERVVPPGGQYESKATTDGKPPRPGLENAPAPAPVNPQTGQNDAYWILIEDERKKGFVRPYRRSYTHKNCGLVTHMSMSIAETFARNPKFYSHTFCFHCEGHFPVDQFVWEGTNEKVGT